MKLFREKTYDGGHFVELGKDAPILSGFGEFSALFLDNKTGQRESVMDWTASEATKTDTGWVLEGEVTLSDLEATVRVQVLYELVNEHVVRKDILLSSDKDLLYSLSARLEPMTEPKSYWTFEKAQFDGGTVYETYPAMGMTFDDVSYGYLTDSGHQNRWTRVSRQTDGLGFLVGLEHYPDAQLMTMATAQERIQGNHYMQYKFGEVTHFNHLVYDAKTLSPRAGWTPVDKNTHMDIEDDFIKLTGEVGSSSTGVECGISLNVELERNRCYEIYFRYRSSCPLALRLLDDTDPSYFEWAKEYGAYRDGIPASTDDEWQTFGKQFITSKFPHEIERPLLKLLVDPSTHGQFTVEVADIEIRSYQGTQEPYHTLRAGEPTGLRLFIFEAQSSHHRQLQISSQTRLSEGLGFEGTQAEKILYADNQMLTWIAQHDNFAAHVVPSLNYHPDMYLRDTFWQVSAVFDPVVSVQCWTRYAATQHEDGQLDTLARAYRYSPSTDDNDSTMFFIMWAYLNQTRYGVKVPTHPLERALANIRHNHSQARDGRYLSRTAGWFDTIWGNETVTAINQGHFAVTLQCAKLLGLYVTDEEIKLAKAAYRGLYDTKRQYVRWSSEMDYLSPSVLLGEFMNLWLFNEPILPIEAVVSTVKRLKVVKRGVPCISDADGELFTEQNKPWEEKYMWRQGVYHNGGSWFLYEYLAYVAAARHGWQSAEARMAWRLEMEFSKEDEPFSHEFIPLTDDEDDWWKTCRVFGWNTFALIANQVASGRYEGTLERSGRGDRVLSSFAARQQHS